MKVVTDASAVIAVAINEPMRGWIIEATRGAEVVAPDSLPFEIANALTRMVKQQRLAPQQALAAWEAVSAIPVALRSIDLRGALRLSCAHNIYAYDGFMLQCALEESAMLLTLDAGMRRVALDLGIDVLE